MVRLVRKPVEVECPECGAVRRVYRSGNPPCPHPVVDDLTPYEDDPICQSIVQGHPAGLTLLEIGLLMGGISRERVRQVEAMALEKVRARLLETHPEAEMVEIVAALGRVDYSDPPLDCNPTADWMRAKRTHRTTSAGVWESM